MIFRYTFRSEQRPINNASGLIWTASTDKFHYSARQTQGNIILWSFSNYFIQLKPLLDLLCYPCRWTQSLLRKCLFFFMCFIGPANTGSGLVSADWLSANHLQFTSAPLYPTVTSLSKCLWWFVFDFSSSFPPIWSLLFQSPVQMFNMQ